jgi:hypothetical protein
MTVEHHAVTRKLMETTAFPDHDPRKASSEYKKVHYRLVVELDEPCWICGVRNSTLSDPDQNVKGSKQMETHHFNVEWAMANGVDPKKVYKDFPDMGVPDDEHFRQWLDSEGNMLVLCDVCHRHPYYGIHMITYPAWVVQRVLRDGYDLVKGEESTPDV